MFKMIRAGGGLLATILHRLTAPVNPLFQRGSNDLKLLDLSPCRRQGPGPDAGENARIGGSAPVGLGPGLNPGSIGIDRNRLGDPFNGVDPL